MCACVQKHAPHLLIYRLVSDCAVSHIHSSLITHAFISYLHALSLVCVNMQVQGVEGRRTAAVVRWAAAVTQEIAGVCVCMCVCMCMRMSDEWSAVGSSGDSGESRCVLCVFC